MAVKNNDNDFILQDLPASAISWKLIQHFSPKEHWGDLDKVSMKLVLTADDFRDFIGVPLLLTPAGEGAAYCTRGHAEESWHYAILGRNEYAMAVDVFPWEDFLAVFEIALHYDKWRGVGAYPYAKYHTKRKLIRGMLHLDIRTTERLYWYRDQDGEYHYYMPKDRGTLLSKVKKAYKEVLNGK